METILAAGIRCALFRGTDDDFRETAAAAAYWQSLREFTFTPIERGRVMLAGRLTAETSLGAFFA